MPALTTAKASRLLGRSPATLRRWRQRGRGPRFIRVDDFGNALYLPRDIEAWLLARSIDPTPGVEPSEAV